MKFILLLNFYLIFFSVPYTQSALLTFSVKEFGAMGDGINDDTLPVQAAIDSASKLPNTTVFFPVGIYSISSMDIKVSILGEKGTVIKNNKKLLNRYVFCNIKKRNSIKIKSLTFDGSVVIDDNGITESGSIPLFVYLSRDIAIENCNFINSPMSGLRVEDSENINVKKCFSGHNRGVFGDGYYFTSVKNSKVENCKAQDYTRIGFVTEDSSSDIVFTSCEAIDGNNASILKGGTEYNAGFWYENSINITTVNCKAIDNTHRGFVATTGGKVSGLTQEAFGNFKFEGCESIRTSVGFYISSSGFPVYSVINNCFANYVSTGFFINAKSLYDKFYFRNCSVLMNPLPEKSLNNVGFNWESPVTKNRNEAEEPDSLPEVTLINCKVSYSKPTDISKLTNPDSNSGDISTYGGGVLRLFIHRFSNSLPGNEVIIKSRTGNPKYNISNTRYNKTFVKSTQIVR